ncbi:MAG: hypothetical protein V9G19_11695 [Tetrasphaera sp.]
MIRRTFDTPESPLLDEVRDVLDALDPMPDDLVEEVKFALTVRLLNAEVAALTAAAVPALRTIAESPPSITFSSASLSVMLGVSEDDRGLLRLDGWVTHGGAEVSVHRPEVTSTPLARAVTDSHGRFVLDELPHGRMCFVIRTGPAHGPSRPAIVTQVIEL